MNFFFGFFVLFLLEGECCLMVFLFIKLIFGCIRKIKIGSRVDMVVVDYSLVVDVYRDDFYGVGGQNVLVGDQVLRYILFEEVLYIFLYVFSIVFVSLFEVQENVG